MQFSSRLPIAIHILLVTDFFKKQQKITSHFIASSVGVNPVVIRNIIGQLKAAGLINVSAGVGGAHLNKPLDEISILDVFNAVEADEDLFHIHEKPNPNCPVGKNISGQLEHKLKEIEDVFFDKMRKSKLSDFLIEDYYLT